VAKFEAEGAEAGMGELAGPSTASALRALEPSDREEGAFKSMI